jgi:predicted nuclease of predicted toxin-antitoxin system
MKFGKTRFYADEDVEEDLISYIREKGYKVFSVRELGFQSRDDRFHLQEARRRKCVLLTRDQDFLNHRRFPVRELKDTAIIILRTELSSSNPVNAGYLLICLLEELAPSGNQNLNGMKVELQGSKMQFYARIKGRIRTDLVDISEPYEDRELFN